MLKIMKQFETMSNSVLQRPNRIHWRGVPNRVVWHLNFSKQQETSTGLLLIDDRLLIIFGDSIKAGGGGWMIYRNGKRMKWYCYLWSIKTTFRVCD